MVVALLLRGPAWSISLLVVFFSVLAGFEFSSICFRDRAPGLKALFAAVCGLVAAAVSLSVAAPLAPLFALLFFTPSEKISTASAVTSAAFAALGAIYCGALLGSISLFFPIASLAAPGASPASSEGRLWILLLLGGIVASDTFAYAFGRLFGVRKLAPYISPGKTWAGAFGSVLGTVLAAELFSFFALPELTPLAAVALGVLLSVFGQIGDLCESLLKRGFSVKDSGRLIPGHGGVLDRLDSLMFGAPLVLLFYWLR